MSTILILEDHEDCNAIYQDLLGSKYQLHFVRSLWEFDEFLRNNPIPVDLLIADLRLPDGTFIEWAQKQNFTGMTTIIVSSLEDEEALKSCFEWGAVDYLVKPFRWTELSVKVSKALGTFQLPDKANELAEIQDTLTLIESKIFQQLTPYQFVSREKLTTGVWKKSSVHGKTLDVHLSNIRKKIHSSPWQIEYEDSRGWRLIKKTT